MVAQAASGSGNFARDIVLVTIGILLGGALNILVTRTTVWLRRRSISKALLCEIKYCCTTAQGVAGFLDTQVIPQWSKGQFSVTYPSKIDTTFWHAAMQNLDHLPRAHLRRLVSFYQFAHAVNSALEVIQHDQQLHQEVAVREGSESTRAKQLAPPVKTAVIKNAQEAAAMCRTLARYKDICALKQLPDNLFGV